MATVACLVTMLFSGWKNNSLKEITKPYLGEYACTQAMFGGEDFLNGFEYITLALEKDNNFTLTFCEKEKTKQIHKGKFSYNEKKQTIALKGAKKMGFQKEYPIKNGEIFITIGMGKLSLALKFEQK
jgi:hypothetical protein